MQEYAIAKLDDTELKKAFIRVKKPKEQMTESDRSRSRERQRDRDRRARKSRSAPRPHGRAGSRGGVRKKGLSCVGGHERLAAVLAGVRPRARPVLEDPWFQLRPSRADACRFPRPADEA